jgi:hypothetical protein
MFSVLICYVINASLETSRICKMLNGIAQQMANDRLLKELSLQVETILLNVQCLLESRDDLIPSSKFVLVDLLAHQVDSLELLSKMTPLNQRDQVQCL